MRRRPATVSNPILILAPVGRDAESAATLVGQHGRAYTICRDLADLARHIDEHTGAVLIAEEALARADPAVLVARVEAQPPWADLPFVYLRPRNRGGYRTSPPPVTLPGPITNVMVLERPLSKDTLLSALDWALAARSRQYQIRDQLAELEEQARMLEETAALLRESEARFRAITESMPQIVWSARADGFHDYFNQRFYDFTGLEPSPGERHRQVGLVHPDDRERTRATWRSCLASGEFFRIEYRLRHRSGVYRWHFGQATPLRDASGRVTRWFGTSTDIDDQVRAREALAAFSATLEREVKERTAALAAETAERQRVESALHQSQKMEAIGQLTGGVAHDFNNYLTGIIGSIDIIRRRLANGRHDDVERFMTSATTSAQRAAALTHRLLAFSRQQTLDPHPVDLGELVLSMRELLERSLHEGIRLEIDLSPGLTPARADANQVESALLNLVLNARDAMPRGGTVTISTQVAQLDAEYASRHENLKPGSYAMLSVRDTGTGMSEATLARAVDPFFTTKPLGQGTGLGLSTIYGFARQSNGHLQIQSEVGRGTMVNLYLPLAAPGETREVEPATSEVPQGRGETILVVEDDPSVRTLVLEVLGELGYAAIEAEDARAAFPVLESEQPLDLMISDVGLPGMNGRQLAEFARRRRAGLKVLFITGYAETESIRSGALEAGMAVVSKPFALDVLANRIRDMMR